MEPYEPHLALATALAVGLLVGLEREQAHPEGTAIAGIRTYPIIALIGAIATLLGPVWIPLVALGGVIGLVAVSYAVGLHKGRDPGMTTEASVIAVYLLGALAASHDAIPPMTTRLLLVGVIAVAITFLLSSKQWMHEFAKRVSREDLYASVKFLIIAVIIVPLLPREAVGPLDAIAPFTVGLMVVMISGLSFIGYIAMRTLGKKRGVLLGAALGGLVSSTAVTVSFSGRVKRDANLAPIAAGAIAIASTIMVFRVGVLVAVTNPSLLRLLGIPLGGAAIGAIVGGILVYRRRGPALEDGELTLKNPFELGTAIRFGLLFAVILIAVKAAKVYLGNSGMYVAASLGGLTDVDAVTLSTARLDTSAESATIAIFVAIASNTVTKTAIAFVIGGHAIGKRAAVIGGCIIAGGALASLAVI